MGDIFDNMRPFTDAEAAEVMPFLASSTLVAKAAKYLYPDKEADYLPGLIRQCKSVDEFQSKVIAEALVRDLKLSNSTLTYSGLERLKKSDGSIGQFLFISTHRDIVLDPAFLELALTINNIPQSEIAVGDNLLSNHEIEVAMRANRMIKVVRSDNPRVVYESSKLLSAYIRDRIAGGHRSVWISHRQGRTKNGYDHTEQGLLKMLDMSGTGSFVDNFDELHLMPVTISYEWETCGALKAQETLMRERQGYYHKQPGEDINSMIQGFLQHKGHVHIDFAEPVSKDELLLADCAQRNDKFRKLAEILDRKFMDSFHLWPGNYAAADILNGGSEYLDKGMYTPEDKERLVGRLKKESEGMDSEVYGRMLSIYAAHLINKQ